MDLNRVAKVAFDYFPFLKNLPSGPGQGSGYDSDIPVDGISKWYAMSFDKIEMNEYDGSSSVGIESYQIEIENDKLNPQVAYIREEHLEKVFKKGIKPILLKMNVKILSVEPENTGFTLRYFVNNDISGTKKFDRTNMYSEEIKVVDNIGINEKNVIKGLAGKEKEIMGSIKSITNKSGIEIETEEDKKYLRNHGNVKIYKNTPLVKWLWINRNYEFGKKSTIGLYKLKDDSDHVVIKESQFKLLGDSLDKELFSKIIYLKTPKSIGISVKEIEYLNKNEKKARIKFIVHITLLFPNTEVPKHYKFQPIFPK